MNTLLSPMVVFVAILDLLILGTSRVRSSVWLLAFQGFILGVISLLMQDAHFGFSTLSIIAGSTAARAVLFPWLLFRAYRSTRIGRIIDSAIPYPAAMLIGVAIIAYALWLSQRLPIERENMVPIIVPIAIATALIGLFLLVIRKQALSQVMGYIVLENGIHLLGLGLQIEEEMLVQLGIMLDIFVGVFVMGIMVYHIRQEFDDINVDRLSLLKE